MHKESALLMGGRTHKIHVELEPGGIVSGVVLDIDGNPVADAEVGVFFADAITIDKIMNPSVDAFTHSDAQGRFRLGGLPSGQFIMEASAPNMVAVWRPGGLMKDAREFRELEILLEPSYVVYGQAIDASEQPIAGVFVTAGKPNRRMNRKPTQYPEVFQHGPRTCLAKSDAEGLFSLDNVPESQSWNINGKHPLFLPVRTSFDAGQQDVWLEMTQGAVLSGNVVDGAGNPIVGAQIWLLSGSGEPTTFTNGDGDFLFGVGKEKFAVSPLIFKQGSGMVFLPPMDVLADTAPLKIVLDGGLTLRGKVQDAEGNGLSGVPVRIAGTPPFEGYLSSQMPERFLDRDAVLTAPDGSFVFNELYDSVFTITARPSGKEAVKAEGVSATSGQTVLTVK
jgi:protocatechuate 3,4-dioxygenase beta subunit